MSLSTGLCKASISNVEFAGLAAKFSSAYADAVFTNGYFGVTPRIAVLGVCRNEAAELAVNVEVDVLRGIVEESNVRLRDLLRCREGTVDQPHRKLQAPFHASQLPTAISDWMHYNE